MQKQEPGPEAAGEGHKPLEAQAHLGLEVWQRAEGRGRSGTGWGGSLGKTVGVRGMIREWAGQVSVGCRERMAFTHYVLLRYAVKLSTKQFFWEIGRAHV